MQITPEQATFLFQTVLPTLENEHSLTLKIMQAVPADKADYRPDPTAMSAFDLCWHMAASQTRFLRAVSEGEFYFGPIEKVKTMPEALAFYEETYDRDLAALKAASGEQLAKIVDFRGMFQLPAVNFITFSINHIVHHRGQLSVYLRPMGAKVPSIYGESYDAQQARMAGAN